MYGEAIIALEGVKRDINNGVTDVYGKLNDLEGLDAGIKGLKSLEDHGPEGHNVTNEQYVELREENEILKEEYETLRKRIMHM